MAHDVFISHASADKPIADAACAVLESHGIRCWIAPRDVVGGMDWSSEIIDAISASGTLVLIFSASSNASEQVKREVARAVGDGLPVIPFRIQDVALSKHMEYFIRTLHWLDALTPPLEAHLQHLAKTVRLVLERSGRPPKEVPEGPERAPLRPAAPPPAVPPPAPSRPFEMPPEWVRWEERVVAVLRPVLRPPPVPEGAAGARPVGAMIAALVVGALGLVVNLTALFRVVFPQSSPPEMWVFTQYPWMRIANLVGSLLGTTGCALLLVGARWILARRPEGAGVVLGASRFLAAGTGLWLVLALWSVTGPGWQVALQNRIVSGIFQVALMSWVQLGVVYFLARQATAPGGSGTT